MEHVQKILSVVESGSEQALRGVLKEGGKVDVCDEEGSSSLLYAAAHGWEDIVRMLLKNNVDVNGTNLYGWTALMQAACYGHLPSVKLLLQMGAKVNLTNRWGATALVGAAQGGFLTIVQVLLEEGAEVNKEDQVESLTALMAASQCGHDTIVTQLITTGSLVNAHLKTTKWTAVMLAVLNNQLSTVKLLLQHGADREAHDVNGRRVAELAAILGHEEIRRLLAGEKQEEKYKLSDNEFFDAVKSGEVKKVGEMLSRRPSLAHITDQDGATPLMFAANKGHVEICKDLLGAGAEVNAKDKVHQWTPLMQATHQKSYAVARLLGQHGADVNHRGKSGLTAFEIATMIADVEMIQIIANISMERIQQQGIPATPTPATPTPATPTTDLSMDNTDGEKRNKLQMPDVSRRLTKEGDGPLDPTVLIKRLRNAYRTPDNVPVLFSSDGQPSSPAPGGPMTRLQSLSHISNTPSPPTVSLEKTPDSSSTTGAPHTKPSPSSFHVGGALRANRGMPAPTQGGANHQGSVLDKFLSKSNPSESGGRWKGAGGGRLQQGKLDHSDSSMPNGSQLLRPKSGKPGSVTGAGGRDAMPSFLQKLPQLGSRLENHLPRRQISYSGTPPKRKPGPRLRNRSNTDPLKVFRPDIGPKKPFLKQLEPLPAPDLRFALEEASLSHYHSVFLEQEVDYHSFVTLRDEDLQEMGITSRKDREKLLSVIARLSTKSEASHGGPHSASKSGTPVFVFQ